MRPMMFLCLLATACGYERFDETDTDAGKPGDEEETVETTAGPDGDSNGDGLEDIYQSFGFGYDPSGHPYFVVFDGPALPPVQSDLWLVGYGGGVYVPEAENTWFEPWAPLVPYTVDKVRTGWAFANMREGRYEVVPVDASSFGPYDGAGWGNPELGLTPYDFSQFTVVRVDGANCPDGGRESTHYLFEVRDGYILPLTQGIAPADPYCP